MALQSSNHRDTPAIHTASPPARGGIFPAAACRARNPFGFRTCDRISERERAWAYRSGANLTWSPERSPPRRFTIGKQVAPLLTTMKLSGGLEMFERRCKFTLFQRICRIVGNPEPPPAFPMVLRRRRGTLSVKFVMDARHDRRPHQSRLSRSARAARARGASRRDARHGAGHAALAGRHRGGGRGRRAGGGPDRAHGSPGGDRRRRADHDEHHRRTARPGLGARSGRRSGPGFALTRGFPRGAVREAAHESGARPRGRARG